MLIFLKSALPLLAAGALAVPLASEAFGATPVSITVRSGARQTFQGFGTSNNPQNGYGVLSQDHKDALSRAVWRDARFRILRLWVTDEELGGQSIARFQSQYIRSGMIADARRYGATTLLLAPSGIPTNLAGADKYLRDSEVGNYAAMLAGFVKKLEGAGVSINATGILNEPGAPDKKVEVRDAQWPLLVKALRSSLDNNGLSRVQIVAPEAPSNDGAANKRIDAIKNDPAAWSALGGIATHSYNMAATDEQASRSVGKEFWMTEASWNGPQASGDAIAGARAASRVLNDLNHRVSHWLWFLGYEIADPNDDQTRMIRYWNAPFRLEKLATFWYLQQLGQTFDVGSRARDCHSSASNNNDDGDMTWSYGPKPKITVAAAKNPDGTWGIGISNHTAPSFSTPNNFELGHAAETFDVSLQVEELARSGPIRFQVRRSNGDAQNVRVGEVTMTAGRVTIPNVLPCDLITLRAASNGKGTGLRGEYFNNPDFTARRSARTDARVNFNWGTSKPAGTKLSDGETFSVHWTGRLQPRYTGAHEFSLSSSGQARLWINGQPVVGAVNLVAGEKVAVRVDLVHNQGRARCKLMWRSPSHKMEAVPQSQLYPS